MTDDSYYEAREPGTTTLCNVLAGLVLLLGIWQAYLTYAAIHNALAAFGEMGSSGGEFPTGPSPGSSALGVFLAAFVAAAAFWVLGRIARDVDAIRYSTANREP
jgi:hypothetical protein